MKKLTLYTFISSIIILLSFEQVSAILCWDCTSEYDPWCADPFDNASFPITDCEYKRLPHLHIKSTMCRKIRQKVYGRWRFIRSCAWLGEPGVGGDERYCLLRTGTWDIHMEYCTCNSKDGCNGATKQFSTNFLFVIPLTFMLIVNRW